MATARAYHANVLLADGRVLVTGGVDNVGGILASAEIYNPRTGQWATTGHMTVGRAGVSAAQLPGGLILVPGGATGASAAGHVLRSAELYDPRTGRWHLTGSMLTARYDYSMTVLRTGQVLVVGGVDAAGYALHSAELYDPRTGNWRETGRMKDARAAHTATLLPNGQVLVSGGAAGLYGAGPVLRDAELYNPNTARWRTASRMDQARAGQTATLLANGKVLVTGGESGQSDADSVLAGSEIYDPRVDSWTPTASMNVSRYGHTATLLANGTVLVTGGQEESVAGEAVNSVELYNPTTARWTMAANMATTRSGHTATLLRDGSVLIVGGTTQDASGPMTPEAEVYNPSTVGGPAPAVRRPRAQFTATLLSNGLVLAAGGVYELPSSMARSSAELFDPRTGAWTATGSMTNARASQTATLLPDGRVLVAGGFDSAGILASAELYDPKTGRWAPTGQMTAARAYHSATLLGDGMVLVAGGLGAAGSTLSSTELYNYRTGRWTPAGRMNAARASQTDTLLPDGRVLVAGGVSGKSTSVLASAELYDPRTHQWARTSAMSQARAGHTATLLSDGRVLVAGGQADTTTGTALYSAEVYTPRTGVWADVSQMTQERVKQTATLLADGRVLVAGGEAMPGSTLNNVEFYDPHTNNWSGTGGMQAARAYHTATLLPGGFLLVAGGVVAGNQVLASAEVYAPRTGTWALTGAM